MRRGGGRRRDGCVGEETEEEDEGMEGGEVKMEAGKG